MSTLEHDVRFRSSINTKYEKMVNELNSRLDDQRTRLEDQQAKIGQSMMDLEHAQRSSSTKPTKNLAGSGSVLSLREQLAQKEEQRQEMVRALAEIRADMVKIAEGNLKAMSDEDKQNLSVQALITHKTAQLQEKIDDYETQIQTLKRELKAQKALMQKHVDEAADARERLGQNEKKLNKLQQQNASLADSAQRRISGQQMQQDPVSID